MRKTVTVTDFTVRGRGPFPFDMLRYDGCWPADGDAVTKIEKCAEETYGMEAPVEIKLRTHSVLGPTVDRWRSFNWSVTEIN